MFERLGENIFRHSRRVLLVAVVIVIAGAVIGAGAFGKLKGSGGFDDPGADSAKVAGLLSTSSGGQQSLTLLVHARQGTVDSPASTEAGQRLMVTLRSDPAVRGVESYWSARSTELRSKDGRDALAFVSLRNPGPGGVTTVVDRYATGKNSAAGAITVRVGGGLAVEVDTNKQVRTSLSRAELIAVPLTGVLLILAFGGLAAALVPLIIGGVAIIGTFAELDLLGRVTNVSVFAINLTTALGLALGVDYSLLIVGRFREQLTAGDDVRTAVVRTVSTAGRTIAFSGATVATALAAMLLFPMFFLRSFAYAGIGVVVIAVLAGLVITPALLALLGRRVNAARLPWRTRDAPAASPFWEGLAAVVMRRPVLTVVPVLAVLLIAGSPLMHVSFGTPDERVLTTAVPSRQVADALHREFPNVSRARIQIVVIGAAPASELGAYAQRLREIPAIGGVTSSAAGASQQFADPAAGSASSVRRLTATLTADPFSGRAQNAVRAVRALAPPAGDRVLVGGVTAQLIDTKASIRDRLPALGVWIVLSTFILLFLFTGSVIQPLRALLVNSLSIAATLGVMTWIFQDGHLASLLGFTPRPMDTAMTVLLFCITFGLCMDYEVFVTSRIREYHETGHDVVTSVRQGLGRTGRIVSTAAGLMAVNFFAFGASSVSFLQMFGLGAGLAVLIDATLVRGVLVPAVMQLLGIAVWYSPGRLQRLHRRIGLSES